MRWPHDSAISRRDAQLARTRRLTVWAAGGATAASFGLAAALGFALPGHTSTASPQPAGSTGQSGSAGGSGQGTSSSSGTTRHHNRRLSPPQQQPAPASAPPVVSSGGS